MSDIIDRQMSTVELMIGLYCKKKHESREMCDDCCNLLNYAHTRLDRCRFAQAQAKGSCKECSSHCYSPAMRERIRSVMRFAGPRMIFYAPLQGIRHLFHR